LNVIVIGVALSPPGAILAAKCAKPVDKLVGTPQISVFLSMGVSRDEISRSSKQLGSMLRFLMLNLCRRSGAAAAAAQHRTGRWTADRRRIAAARVCVSEEQ
jgi:hypothetical protein